MSVSAVWIVTSIMPDKAGIVVVAESELYSGYEKSFEVSNETQNGQAFIAELKVGRKFSAVLTILESPSNVP